MRNDFTRLTDTELRNVLNYSHKNGDKERVVAAIREMRLRNIATKPDFRVLDWNQERVKDFLAPFAEVSKSVPGNRRTAYTEAGGFKIGRKKDDPEKMWIDTYTAIKTDKINAILVCYIRSPGDEPELQIQQEGQIIAKFALADRDMALKAWTAVAGSARS